MVLHKLKKWYAKYERPISSLSLLAGFAFDALTLKRVDLFLENLWVAVHLLVAALGIIFLNVYENRKDKMSQKNASLIHFWLIIIVQFAFGGLLSTFLVFYFRSATLSVSWPFMLFLVAVFASNELLKQHYSKVVFQTIVLFICIYAFAIYIVPVIMHKIGAGIFLLSGAVSLVLLSVFLIGLWYISRERFRTSRNILLASIGGILIFVNALYFTHLIPPIPLSLKDAGIYYSLKWDKTQGNYIGLAEAGLWSDFFKPYPVVRIHPDQHLYAYTAIFSPADLNTTVIHRWQYYDESKKEWTTVNSVVLPINGGRDDGYRTYSQKSSTFPGRWRVDVLTPRGELIGRVKFALSSTSDDFIIATSTL